MTSRIHQQRLTGTAGRMIGIPDKMAVLEDIDVSCTDCVIRGLEEAILIIYASHTIIIRKNVGKDLQNGSAQEPRRSGAPTGRITCAWVILLQRFL